MIVDSSTLFKIFCVVACGKNLNKYAVISSSISLAGVKTKPLLPGKSKSEKAATILFKRFCALFAILEDVTTLINVS